MKRALPMLLLSACSEQALPVSEPLVPDVPNVALELLYAVRTPTGEVVAGSLTGALEAGASVDLVLPDGSSTALGPADERGRASVVLSASVGDTATIIVDGRAVAELTVRDFEQALLDAVHPPLAGGAGSIPNDLIILGAHEAPSGILVRSGDNAVSTVDLNAGLDESSSGARLPSLETTEGTLFANPWFVAALDDQRVAVTAFGQRHVYVIDIDTFAIERTLAVEGELRIDPPRPLSSPFDLDGDGTKETEISRFVPRAPQPIALVGSYLVVGFTGFLAPRLNEEPPVYLPSVLAVWNVDALDTGPRLLVLPLSNPQEIRSGADGAALVACSGVIDQVGGETLASTPGGVVAVDLDALEIVRSVEMQDFGTSSVIERPDALWISSAISPKVRAVDPQGEVSAELVLNDEPVDSLFRLIELPGGLIGAPSFNTDRLYVIDPVTSELDPPPFFAPLVTGSAGQVFDGLQVVATRPGRMGVDYAGASHFALHGLASTIVPIELRKVLGP